MACNDKVKQRCGVMVYAPCVKYEKEIPTYSPLHEEPCISIEETTEDLYNQVGVIRDEMDLSALGQLCLTYVSPPQTLKVKNILLKFEQEICDLKEKVRILEEEAICDKDITQCGLDLSDINDQCANPIQTLGQLLQYFITQTTP